MPTFLEDTDGSSDSGEEEDEQAVGLTKEQIKLAKTRARKAAN